MPFDHWNQSLAQNELSGEAAVEILDYLQRFMTDFENRYAYQIHRYNAQRSRRTRLAVSQTSSTDDEPF